MLKSLYSSLCGDSASNNYIIKLLWLLYIILLYDITKLFSSAPVLYLCYGVWAVGLQYLCWWRGSLSLFLYRHTALATASSNKVRKSTAMTTTIAMSPPAGRQSNLSVGGLPRVRTHRLASGDLWHAKFSPHDQSTDQLETLHWENMSLRGELHMLATHVGTGRHSIGFLVTNTVHRNTRRWCNLSHLSEV